MANRIRRARALAHLSQSELALQVGVTRSAVAQWESRANIMPSTGHLSRIAVATGVQFEWLATGRGPCQLEDQPVEPVGDLKEFAQTDTETRMLALLRRLSAKKQQMMCDMVEMMSA
ncbi:helix-turn-helix transcriptional regulator [Lysobacter terrae]